MTGKAREMTAQNHDRKDFRREGATLALDREEGAALVSACLAILLDLLAKNDLGLFPDVARPLFRVYSKLCALSNHKVNLEILRASVKTWGRPDL